MQRCKAAKYLQTLKYHFMIQQKKIPVSNIFSILIMALALLVIFNPNAKGYLIRGLMSLGFFQPDPRGYVKHQENVANVPDIQFKDAAGNATSLSTLKSKVVFINYWATWCPPCIAEMPKINELYKKFRNDPKVAFLLVDVDNDLPKAKAFMLKNRYDLPLYLQDSNVPGTLLGGTIPTTLVFDKEGKLIYKHSGAADYSSEEFEKFMRNLD
ncbi:TlpA family protein disulfide reductase [Mucilaginibacter rubeus]|uniref:TlpA family protein disulfide reductase n=2 Tax=Mucilaginibacter rubeus TaxID=2027860 RepID=A0AAE6JD51_9SPHI|nr:TlpA family protein disulfide reductase [Mucilaginibacter rubeus]QEM15859.1 TlpA family protein disulfide reductase [Mucilaginibacter gossypii]